MRDTTRGINEGHPPSTGEWNEFEARQGEIGHYRSRPAKGGTPRKRPPLPLLTDQQIASSAKWLYADLVLLIDAFDAAPWDDRWTNRLMQALTSARNTLNEAARKPANPVPAAGDNPADGSGAEAGDGDHPPQPGLAQTKKTPGE